MDKTCSIKDDDFHEIFSDMIEAGIIIVGSPVYFGSATPQLMALLDRAGHVSHRNNHLLSRKVGGPIVVARRAGQNFTYAQLLYWYTINDMIVVGSSYWNIAFGHAPRDVLNDEEGLTTIDRFAENLIWISRKLQ
jgi:multimeric flavodoxin WrbA